jgi:hypothetical protein
MWKVVLTKHTGEGAAAAGLGRRQCQGSVASCAMGWLSGSIRVVSRNQENVMAESGPGRDEANGSPSGNCPG